MSKYISIILSFLAIVSLALLAIKDKFQFEPINKIFNSIYTSPTLNIFILITSIYLYYKSRKQDGDNGSITSMLSFSMLAFSTLSIVSDLMKMADNINVNQCFTIIVYLVIFLSYPVMLVFMYKEKIKTWYSKIVNK